MTKLIHALTKLKTNIAENPRAWFSRFIFALGPAFAYCAVEVLNNNNPFTDLELWRVAWNIGWYIAIFAFFWLVTGCRRGPGALCAALVSFIFGLVNHYVLRFRGSAIFPIDLLSWRTAANVAGAYDYSPDGRVWIALGITAVYAALVIIGGMRRGARPKVWACGSVSAALCVFLGVFFLTGLLPELGIYAEQWQTRRNGFVFNFMTALRYGFLDEPGDYELEDIERFKLDYMASLEEEAQPEKLSETEPTNVIIIMNESWADLSIYENYSASADTMNNINSLEENTVRGYMYSPVIGGGTANVEYEVLTGCPYLFLPTGTVAYQLYIDSASPSLASLAAEDGGETWAFHPYLSSGWNRIQAYGYLGFEGQIYDDDMAEPEKVRQYISDEADFELLTELTEEAEGECFIFNVTMQNHSGYDQSWTNLPRTVRLTGELRDSASSSSAEQYLALADETDRAFADLVEYYENSPEPTIIAMFGDHQPPLGTEFFEELLGGEERSLSDEELLVKYQVPFVVWANYDIPEAEGVELSTNYFGLMVSDLAGFERTPYMDFIADVAEELPVIHRLGFVTDEGEFVDSREELDSESLELLETYEELCYNYLSDREPGDEFFEGTD